MFHVLGQRRGMTMSDNFCQNKKTAAKSITLPGPFATVRRLSLYHCG